MANYINFFTSICKHERHKSECQEELRSQVGSSCIISGLH